ncbi:tRNA(Met) cytidine acetyltransferase TmcA [Tatumella punctata]|uniref:tRNA(Met) cytidine acetyltransferase TmcA n=1 Tax=Tatumella punctata TaxID=399969 RepID=A0ABW1VRQ1_9GAMM
MTDWQTSSEQMRRTGIRRICIISGDKDWVTGAARSVRNTLTGDWLTVSADLPPDPRVVRPSAVKSLLGREYLHGIFDARDGFHAESLACMAGTLLAGSWLLLLLPPKAQWMTRADQDSLRWADTTAAIAVPRFMSHFASVIGADSEISHWQQHQPLSLAPLKPSPDWQCRAAQQQQDIIRRLQEMEQGVAVLTAARGRGKSALAGMLARISPGTIVSAPAKVSTGVLQTFAGDNFRFIAPDALLADPPADDGGWLIVDEAAAIPAPLLRQMTKCFSRVLLSTTVQGYEGTGRGFLLKFCAGLPEVSFFSLSEPLRWSVQDPLERFIDQLFLFDESGPLPAGEPGAIHKLSRDSWLADPRTARALYQLLSSAHYRTTPLDLRRMMDAPGMHFWLAEGATALPGALWLVEEGGLSQSLSNAVWAGFRRPKGNLVAQSLAAHAGFPQAASMRSRRISRVAVDYMSRRQGTGKALVMVAIASTGEDCDYISVSFGFTTELWQFWQACGFRLVRFGTQPEASSGCYAAMAIRPLSAAGEQLATAAEQRLWRDWEYLAPRWLSLPGLERPSAPAQGTDSVAGADWQELAGFAWGSRPYESSYPALRRLLCRLQQWPETLAACADPVAEKHSIAAAGGRKAWLRKLRAEVSQQLIMQDIQQAQDWQQQLQQLRHP